MRLWIKTLPLAQKRHRLCKNRFYDPSSNDKKNTALLIQTLMKLHPYAPFDPQPLKVSMVFMIPPPKSLSLKKQKDLYLQPHAKKPDIDNFIKFYLDVMKGLCYQDDNSISSVSASKVYGPDPLVQITILPCNKTEDVISLGYE